MNRRQRTASSDQLNAYKAASTLRSPSEREAEILRHLPLVHTIVDRIASTLPPNLDREDLFHAGVIGLIDAIDRFDCRRDTAFSTYAVLRIRGAIIDDLRSRDWVPRGARQRAKAYHQAIEDLLRIHDRAPSDDELARHLGISVDQLADMERDAQLAMQVSLDTPIGDDGHLEAVLPAQTAVPAKVGQAIDREEQEQVLEHALAQLDEQDRIILKLYYFEGLLMKEVAAVIGKTESRVCQIHARLMAVLRSRLRSACLL